MTAEADTAERMEEALRERADPGFAEAVQRYFPNGIPALGVRNAEVAAIVRDHFAAHPDIPPAARLAIADRIVGRAAHHEEVLLGFAVLHKVARRRLGPELLHYARKWLSESVGNWAQCDDLCLKLLHPFFLGHLDLIPQTRAWIDSPSPWCRRAANVAMVKLVRVKVGRETYRLPTSHVFDNCTRLMHDPDDYVQKGCGWLLKATSQVHPDEVVDYLRTWHGEMKRSTFRYAIEKLDTERRAALMSLGDGRRG